MANEETVIRLAYGACGLTPSQESFRRGDQKKTYNPVHTAPLLNRVITHLEGQRDFDWARRQAGRIVLDEKASQFIDGLATQEALRHFLATLSLFLKTTETKDRRAMRTYAERESKPLTPEQIAERAWQIARDVKWRTEFNKNKMTRLAGRVRGARGKWECLAVLAQYYPLKGVSQDLINRLVQELETTDLGSFQALVSQTQVLYDAEDTRQRARQA